MTEQYPILQGAEPFFLKGNDVGVLISHGFAGTPQSVRFLGEYIAQQGYTVYGTRLKGHGTHYKDMENCTYDDWIQSLEEGYHFLKRHCRKIFIMGQSMGGTLAIHLAGKYEDIKGMIVINAAMTTIPVFEALKDKHEPRFVDEGAPDIKAKDAYEIAYAKAPIQSIQQLLLLMNETRRTLESITCPTLAFASKEDHVVPPENTDYVIRHIKSEIKETITLYNSYHVASMDYEKEFIAEQSCLFLEKHIGNQREMKTFLS
ncbi:alpha/beta hydrolase [Ectobacillus panaciterrae]|uniref:alpha/beta hydrolase n=1 Tax=Ectobacillus panaciterrae TaxID=363872 RepID=UPI000402E796|nr:alpha/beta fold hydrolase [Ectobacillus panaciterrae]